jgi:hypothetical protein
MMGQRRDASLSNPFYLLSPYDLRNLPHHCIAAGRENDLHRLLSISSANGTNAWFEIKDGRGAVAEYVADLALARKVAEAKLNEPGAIAL